MYIYLYNIQNNSSNSSNNDEILKLKNELNQAKKTIEEQKITIEAQKNTIKEQKITINEQKITIQNLQKQLNNINNLYNNNLQFYINSINKKEEELNNLKFRLQNNPIVPDESYKRNEIKVANFISIDQKIHFAIACIGSDIFAEVEEKLYKKFPEYRETNNSFLFNGQPILRFKTIDQNKIEDGLPITMVIPNPQLIN